MKEEDARRLALVRAIESEDTAEALLTRDDRLYATGVALAEMGNDEAGRRGRQWDDNQFLARRSALALDRLGSRYPAVAQVERRSQWPSWIDWMVLLGAVGLGVVSNVIDGRRLSIIAFPMLAMLLWNLAVYVILVARTITRLASARRNTGPGYFATLIHSFSAPTRLAADAQPPLARGLGRYLSDWLSWSRPLTARRAARLFHLAAAALAIGVLAGMYWRALGTEYRAGWESTLLGPQAVHGLVHLMLSPASQLSGIALPDPNQIEALRWSAGRQGDPAGQWLHLYAATAILFIIGPRLLLAGWNALLAARLKARFPVPGAEDFYIRRLIRSLRGGAPVVRVIPYSFHPPEGTQRRLERLLGDVLGEKTRMMMEPPIAYGAEDEWLDGLSLGNDDADHLIVLFNLSSTPETENHGALVGGIRRRIVEMKSGSGLTVLLDEAALRQRLGTDASARLESRRAAWEAMLREQHIVPLSLDLDAEPSTLARPLEGALLHAHAGAPA